MDKLVSVNITTFNRSHLLSRCLDSVITQSYQNLEINVVDDCSTDDTSIVVASYQEKDNRIRYFRHDNNKGNAGARNTALKQCSGHFVAFMDDDDEWIDKDKLKKQVSVFEKYQGEKLAIVCTSVRLFENQTQFLDKVISSPKDLFGHILNRNGIIYSPTVMTTRDIMENVGGFDSKLFRGVDSDFYRNCIVKYGYDVHFMPDITTAIYEYGGDRITSTVSNDAKARIVKNQWYILKKYNTSFLKRPRALARRLLIVCVNLASILSKRK